MSGAKEGLRHKEAKLVFSNYDNKEEPTFQGSQMLSEDHWVVLALTASYIACCLFA